MQQALLNAGLEPAVAEEWTRALANKKGADAWHHARQELLTPEHPMAVHRALYQWCYHGAAGLKPMWEPTQQIINSANLSTVMQRQGISSYAAFHAWSVQQPADFLQASIDQIGVPFDVEPEAVLDVSNGVEHPQWLVGARFNVAKACLKAPSAQPAIISQRPGQPLTSLSYAQLDAQSSRVANGLEALGLKAGDAVAIDMPMTAQAVIAYLGIVKAGMVVVSIADSFAPDEIKVRLELGKAKAVITQDVALRGSKQLPMYEKVQQAAAPLCIVIPAEQALAVPLRDGDMAWEEFLSENEQYNSLPRKAHDHVNILFSSGTTGTPKVIPWTQATALKPAIDGFYHQDIKQGSVVAWPTNLGWMMGPWLIFATLINQGTVALYEDAPMGEGFGRFVQDAKVNVLGLVPSIVKAWEATGCLDGLDWSAITLFSSTGECSNPDDYHFLMSRVTGYRPVIEYCGGTEIGGAYLTSTVLQANIPSTFSTPSVGNSFYVLHGDHQPCKSGQAGEVFLCAPALGLSTELIGKDHYATYFEGAPKGPNDERLRIHGDEILVLDNGYYQALGRADDTMNLGGIKTSSAEVERALSELEPVHTVAAIGVSPKGGGPAELVIFATLKDGLNVEKDMLKKEMQAAIKTKLNPLFKVEDVVIKESLPRTATGKIMRRLLRDEYQS